jgi:hypothetical protein
MNFIKSHYKKVVVFALVVIGLYFSVLQASSMLSDKITQFANAYHTDYPKLK